MRISSRLLVVASAVVLLGAGCIQITGSGSGSGTDGGVFRSSDRGAKWQSKSAIATVGQARNFANANITALAFDPADKKAVYAGTEGGLFYSYDGGESWQGAGALGAVRVNSMAVSPADKCTVYVATGNRVMRTTDCSRTWENVYFDSRPNTRVNSVVIDHFNPMSIFAATSQGDLLKSGDAGGSWTPIHRFENEVRQLLPTASDSRVMYVGTRNRGVWKTTDGGATWVDLSPGMGEYAGALDSVLIAEDVARGNTVITASNYGLLRSTDGGTTWTPITLLTPSGSTVIYSLAVSPKDSNFIVYGTLNTLYRTVDGGAKWTTSKLPTTRASTNLLIDPTNDSTIFMGTTLFKQNSGF
ncbi:MAG: hypothetical protein QY323_02185 [Patescibacteria group bacterium]|nr:MAG: hypothetical protein QY323_02185 [Patescibacteria group bacterium]